MADLVKDPLWIVLNHSTKEALEFERYLLKHMRVGTSLGKIVARKIRAIEIILEGLPNVVLNLYFTDRRQANALYKWYAVYIKPQQ